MGIIKISEALRHPIIHGNDENTSHPITHDPNVDAGFKTSPYDTATCFSVFFWGEEGGGHLPLVKKNCAKIRPQFQ